MVAGGGHGTDDTEIFDGQAWRTIENYLLGYLRFKSSTMEEKYFYLVINTKLLAFTFW